MAVADVYHTLVDLYRREQASYAVDPQDGGGTSSTTIIIVVVIVVCVLVIAALVGIFVYRGVKKAAREKGLAVNNPDTTEWDNSFADTSMATTARERSRARRDTLQTGGRRLSTPILSFQSRATTVSNLGSLTEKYPPPPVHFYSYNAQRHGSRTQSPPDYNSQSTPRESLNFSRDSTIIEDPHIMQFATIRHPQLGYHSVSSSSRPTPRVSRQDDLSAVNNPPPMYYAPVAACGSSRNSFAESEPRSPAYPTAASTLATTAAAVPSASTLARRAPSVRSTSIRRGRGPKKIPTPQAETLSPAESVLQTLPSLASPGAAQNFEVISSAEPTVANKAPVAVHDEKAPVTTEEEEDEVVEIMGTYEALLSYDPQMSDELAIAVGDHLALLQKYDDGWALGINLSRDRAKGVFPLPCIE